MKNKIIVITAMMAGITIATPAMAEYSGKGGMSARSISPEVYEYHYKNGFTGEDAMGWDENLQYAWSRAGAAITCNIEFDKEKILEQMSKKYGLSSFMHDLNGVGFHNLQSKNIPDFCTAERMEEIKSVLPKFEAGDFPELF